MSDEQIIEKLGLGNLPKEVQDETLESVNHVVELRVMGMIDDLLTDEQREQFEKLSAETSDPKEIFKWVSAEVTDVNKLYDAALADYLEEKTSK